MDGLPVEKYTRRAKRERIYFALYGGFITEMQWMMNRVIKLKQCKDYDGEGKLYYYCYSYKKLEKVKKLAKNKLWSIEIYTGDLRGWRDWMDAERYSSFTMSQMMQGLMIPVSLVRTPAPIITGYS